MLRVGSYHHFMLTANTQLTSFSCNHRNRLNPTMVGFDQSRKMGEHALSNVTSNYRNTVFGMKRLVGLAFDDARARKEMSLVPVDFCRVKRSSGDDGIGVKVQLNGDESVVPVEAVLGMMVKHMGMIAAEKAAETSPESADLLFPQDWGKSESDYNVYVCQVILIVVRLLTHSYIFCLHYCC
jgi:molecular chaperone DnaK (HSP70)